MGRLIDADALIAKIAIHADYEYERTRKQAFSEIADFIRNAPTAYDVDNIVAELEKIEDHCMEMYDWQGQSAIYDAIDIVKRGGVR